jgi:hypothetical protein
MKQMKQIVNGTLFRSLASSRSNCWLMLRAAAAQRSMVDVLQTQGE